MWVVSSCADFALETRAREAQEVHIRRGVDDAQGAVDGEGVDARLEIEALGEDDLEDVAGGDVLLGAFDGFEERAPARAGREAEFAGGLLRAEFRQRLGQTLLEAVETAERVDVGGLGLVAAQVRGDDEQDLLLDVVEGEDLVEEHQAGVGEAQVVGGVDGQALDLADDVVGKKADGSGGEGWQALHAGGLVSVEGVAQQGEDVAGDFARLAVLGDLDLVAVGDDAAAGADADVGVAAEVLAAFDGFEEEALGFGRGETEEGGDGRFEVGGERAVERDERVRARKAEEVGAVGQRGTHGF